jgi:DNA-binding transcriptional ArsR family regulator
MATTAMFAEIAALAGDRTRANMLHALMDGGALTATALARVAGISPQTASGHLYRLTSVGLVTIEKQGRFRLHRLANPSVARMVEAIMLVAAELEPDRSRFTVEARDVALRKARTCYDHFAGRLGVSLADALVERGFVQLNSEAGVLTEAGLCFLSSAGLDTAPMMIRHGKHSSRLPCRACFDWSERRAHLGGTLGALICTHSLSKGWVRRMEGTRAVLVTAKGKRIFGEIFGARID